MAGGAAVYLRPWLAEAGAGGPVPAGRRLALHRIHPAMTAARARLTRRAAGLACGVSAQAVPGTRLLLVTRACPPHATHPCRAHGSVWRLHVGACWGWCGLGGSRPWRALGSSSRFPPTRCSSRPMPYTPPHHPSPPLRPRSLLLPSRLTPLLPCPSCPRPTRLYPCRVLPLRPTVACGSGARAPRVRLPLRATRIRPGRLRITGLVP